MSRTLANLRTFERYILDEKAATFWEDPELDLFTNLEYNNLVTEINSLHAGYFEEEVILTATPGSTLVPLPANHGGEILYLIYEGNPLGFKITKERIHAASGLTVGPPGFFGLQGMNIVLSAPAGAAYSLTLGQTYIPPDMTGDLSVPDFPHGYELLISLGTVIYALMKDKQTLQDMEKKYLTIKQRMFTALQSRQVYKARRVREI
jgi:hypothetical protein